MKRSSREPKVADKTTRGRSRAHCSPCGHLTNHDVIAVDREEYEETIEDRNFSCYDNYEMLKCRGCGAVTLRVISQHIEDREPRTTCYPAAIARRVPEWMTGSFDTPSIPFSVYFLMSEVYTAVQNDLLRLAGMGIRATLEELMRVKVGDHRTFKVLVDEFQKAGYLSTRQAGSLDSILEAGHAAIHRTWEPTATDIATLLDITESVIETAYLHERRARDLDERVPKRPKPA